VKLIARVEVDVGVLFCDFEMKGGLAGGEFSQGGQNIGAAEQRITARLGGSKFAASLGGDVEGKSKLDACKRFGGQTERLSDARAGISGLAGSIGIIRASLGEGNARQGQLGPGQCSGPKALFEQA